MGVKNKNSKKERNKKNKQMDLLSFPLPSFNRIRDLLFRPECNDDEPHSITYYFVRQLGTGTFGEVNLARDNHGKFVAIKKLEKSRNKQAWILREISNMERIKGLAGTSQLIRHVEHKTAWILIFDFINAENVLDLLMRTKAGVEEATCQILFRKLVTIIQNVHKLGLIHHDIVSEKIWTGLQ